MTAQFTRGGGGGGGYDYVQDAEPADAETGETWFDTGANSGHVYDGATWLEQTVTNHSQLSGVGAGTHHTPGVATYNQTSEPTGNSGESWFNPDNGVYYVHDGSGWKSIPPAQVLDEATAFDGSDGESIAHNGTTVSGGSIELLNNARGDTISGPSLSGWGTESGNPEAGLIINPNVSIAGLEFDIEPQNLDSGTLRLRRHSDGTVLDSKNINPSNGDDTNITVNASMSAGTAYRLTFEDGDKYHEAHDGHNFPNTSGDFDVTDGYEEGMGRNSNRWYDFYNITSIKSPTSGNALIYWGNPEDVGSWDLATFSQTLDGETVTIDVEDGSGNVLYSDIGQNFDISTVGSSKTVRIRARLSRSTTSNHPRLDYAARRYVR